MTFMAEKEKNKEEKKEIEIFIDNKKIFCRQGQTILAAAWENKIDIPSLCYHPDLKVKENCRLCIVEIEGKEGFYPACSTLAENGMRVIINSPQLNQLRKTNLELIFSQHREECDDCVWRHDCRLLELKEKIGGEMTRFSDRKKSFPFYQFGAALIFDTSKCLDCRNCVEVCEKEGIGFLEIKKRNNFFQVLPSKKKSCVLCGQCLLACPAGAFEEVGEFEELKKIDNLLREKDKAIIIQFAPSIVAAIGGEFGLNDWLTAAGKLVGALKRLGAKKVFDISVGADFVAVEEAKELEKRWRRGGGILPIFSSFCPSWVKFIEVYFPAFIPYLSPFRSPHLVLGGLIKTFWAKKEKINPKKIKVISVNPCVAAKDEIRRKGLKINGLKPVDYVLSARELVRLLSRHKINPATVEPQEPDKPFDISSGAGLIYEVSGGEIESIARMIYYHLTDWDLTGWGMREFKEGEMREAFVEIGERELKMAAVDNLTGAVELLKKVEKEPGAYDYLEVMACPHGCLGGGGQLLPLSKRIREQRAKELYKISEKRQIYRAEDNRIVKKVQRDFISPRLIKKIYHVDYRRQNKLVVKERSNRC